MKYEAFVSGTPISFFNIIGMSLRKIPPRVIVWQDSGCISSKAFWESFSGAECDRREKLRHVRAGFATNIVVGDAYEQGTAHICQIDESRCETQGWKFLVSPLSQDNMTSQSLFRRQPEISVNGTLSFILNRFRTGSVSFNVRMQDDGPEPNLSIKQYFTITVKNVNEAPTFYVPARIVGFEDLRFDHVAVVNVSAGPFEEGQNMSFYIKVDDPSLFVEMPSIRLDGDKGVLKFVPREDVFGRTRANITLVDDGGTEWWGANSSSNSTMIEIFPVNEVPSLVLAKDVFAFESPRQQVVQGVVIEKTVGPDNENGICSSLPGDCTAQVLDFQFQYASNPNLFTILPQYHACMACRSAFDDKFHD